MADENNAGNQNQAGDNAVPFIDADGNFKAEWYKDKLVPAELQTDPTLMTTKSFGALVSQLVNAQKAVGADKVTVPGKNAKPEDWANLFGKLGLPKDAAGYVDEKGQPILSRPPEIPDELWSEDTNKEFAELALTKAHLLPWQLKVINDWYNSKVIQGYKAQQDKLKSDLTVFEQQLNKSWGTAKPEILKQVDMVLARYFDKKPESFERLQASGILKNMDIVGFLADVARDLDIDKGRGMGISTATPSDIQTQIRTLQAEKAYQDPNHPQNREITDKVTKLYEALATAQGQTG